MYHGDEMLARLAEIRSCAAAVEVRAAASAISTRHWLTAADLASAATALAAAAVQTTDMDLHAMPEGPDLTLFDQRVEDFPSEVTGHCGSMNYRYPDP